MSTNENVLVIPSEHIPGLSSLSGFDGNVDLAVRPVLESSALRFMPRSEAETNENFKQIIPYVMIRYFNEHLAARYYTYVRGNAQGEARLHAKVSFGVGGHINDQDSQDPFKAFLPGTIREIKEEVTMQTDVVFSPEVVGAVYDPTTSVGRVHYGIVMVLHASHESAVKNNDASAENIRWQSVVELRQNTNLEAWSRLCLSGLHPPK